jgi:hypothetical protein
MSGRTVYHTNGETWSAPYVSPYGDPEEWATIPPEHVDDFSAACIDQAITIWQAVERASDTKIPSRAVPRQLRGVRDEKSFVFALQRQQKREF